MFFLAAPAVRDLTAAFTADHAYSPVQFWESPSSRAPLREEIFVERFGTEPFLRLEQVVLNASDTARSVAGGGPGALERDLLDHALDLQNRIAASTVEVGDGERLALRDICHQPFSDGRCLMHSPLEFWGAGGGDPRARFQNDSDPIATLSNPAARSSFGIPMPLHSVLGGVVEKPSDSPAYVVASAESIVITYFLLERRADGLPFSIPVVEIWDRIWAEAVSGRGSHRVGAESGAVVSQGSALKDWTEVSWRGDGEAKHLYYEFGKTRTLFTGEFVVLSVSYLIVFLYISLVMGRVDLVKSKFALGFGAVFTVFASLVMSVGLCSMLGVTTSLVPWEVLPFLVIAVGVENIFVLTKAVVMTSLDLPVKERVGL
ncbi:sterol-sensing domain of SREBP cleavage-activation-domain-containing protein, partial [Blyttiomyces helicus]